MHTILSIYSLKKIIMLKKISFLAVAAFAIAACSNDEIVDVNQGRGISFRASSDKNTRALETTNANLTDFYVTALADDGGLYFDNLLFEGSQGGSYVSDPLYYWPGEGGLTFHAYAPEAITIGGTLTLTSSSQTLQNFSPKSNISDQVDLIYANATGNKTDNEASGVQLNFNHMLSQIELQALNENTAYIYKIKGFRIGKPVSKGDLDFSRKEWTSGSEKAIYQVELENEITLTETAQSIMAKVEGANDNAMLIPQQLVAWDPETDGHNSKAGAYLSVFVDIDTKDGANVYPTEAGQFAWAAVGIATNWEAGKKYVYKLDFSNGAGNVDPDDPEDPGDPILGEPIKFTVDVSTWSPADQNVDM